VTSVEQAERHESLHLDPSVVDDDELLAEVVDQYIRVDADAADTLTEIARLHGVLHELADAHWWPIFASAEELTVARWAELAVSLARWAFNEGRKHPVVPEEQRP